MANVGSITSLLRALPVTVMTLDLMCQDPDYSPVSGLPNTAQHERVPHVTTLNISLSTTFDEYWQARSRKLRQNLRRALREIEAMGVTPELSVVDDPQGMTLALKEYAAMESRGWKAEGGTAVDLETTQGHFYSDMLSRFARRRQAAFYELRLGDRLAASQIVLGNRTMLITLKTTHDENLAQCSPGNVLDYLLLKREFGMRRVAFIEYYTNASTELLRWGSAHRTISHHRWYRSRWIRPLVEFWRRSLGGSLRTAEQEEPGSRERLSS
jgi:CelD/BcsL family acetyltransferase involved in cellulose biosynthesis